MSDLDKKRIGKIALSLGVLFFLSYAYFFQSGQHNENARFDQVRSLLELGHWQIDSFAGNTADVVTFNGHVYPNKAPGSVLIALPVWWFFSTLFSLFGPLGVKGLNLLCYLTTVFTISLLSAISGAVLFRIAHRLSGSIGTSILIAIGYALGTIAFPFSTLFFSHQLAASLLLIAFGLVFFAEEEGVYWRAPLAGFIAGFSIVCEYPAALGAAVIGLYSMFKLKKMAPRFLFVMAGVLACSVVLLYHYQAFGSPFVIPYSLYGKDGANASFTEHRLGFMGVQAPSYKNLVYILFSLSRGLFVVNPWLVFLIPAAFAIFFIKDNRAESVAFLAIVTLFISFNAGFGEGVVYAGGAASTGPRHVIPMLPFAALLIASMLRWSPLRWPVGAFILPSVAFMVMSTATEPRVPYEYNNPVRDLFLLGFKEGRLAPERNGPYGAARFTDNSVAFNLGKVARLPGAIQLLPLFIIWGAFLGFGLRRGAVSPGMAATGWASLLIFSGIPIVTAANNRVLPGDFGLKASYMRNSVWSGCAPTVTPIPSGAEVEFSRLDPVMSFDWTGGGPLSGAFSVEWSGAVIVPEAGTYHVATRSDDGSCLYVDGALVIENWGIHGAFTKEEAISLTPGPHEIVIHFENVQFGAFFELLWGRPGGTLDLIPKEILRPAMPVTDSKQSS